MKSKIPSMDPKLFIAGRGETLNNSTPTLPSIASILNHSGFESFHTIPVELPVRVTEISPEEKEVIVAADIRIHLKKTSPGAVHWVVTQPNGYHPSRPEMPEFLRQFETLDKVQDADMLELLEDPQVASPRANSWRMKTAWKPTSL